MHRALALVGLALLGGVASTARAGEPENAPPDLSLRVYDLTALTSGFHDFFGNGVGAPADPRETRHGSELFEESEEATWGPLGGVDELLEHVKVGVEPESWTQGDAEARSMRGKFLVVRQSGSAHEQIGALLRGWEGRFLRATTVEVRAVRLAADALLPLSASAWNGLLSGPDAGPGVTLSGFPGQKVSGFTGHRRTYVGDYDLGRPGARDVPEARIGLANLGLLVDVAPIPSADGARASVHVRASLADGTTWSTVEVAGGRRIEVARSAVASIDQRVELPVGAWRLLDGTHAARGQSRWGFAVRVTPDSPPEARSAPGIELPRLPPGVLGDLRLAQLDIRDLTTPRYDRRGWSSPCHETPSGVEPIAAETVADLVKMAFDTVDWSEPAAVEVTKGTLIVCGPERALDGATRLLRALEGMLLYRVEMDAEVVEAPAGLELGGGNVLSDADVKRLAASVEAGSSVRHERLHLTHASGARNALVAGEVETYLANLDVEPGDAAVSPTPRLLPLLDGIDLDLHPHVTCARDGVALEVRFLRSEVQRPLRELQVPLGKIQLPEYATQRLRVALFVPFGRTAVAGSFVVGERRTLLLVTPRLVLPGD